jgi:hypothetical protein
MLVTLAMRLLMPKKAAMAAMSQASSASKPCAARAAWSASLMACASKATFMAKSSIASWRGDRSALR